MQIIMSIIDYFRKPSDRKSVKPPKPTAVQKHQAKELAQAKMALAQAESAQEYYHHQAEMYRSRIDRIEGDDVSFRVGGSA